MIEFRICPHRVINQPVVEFYEDAVLVAVLYPDNRQVRIISKFPVKVSTRKTMAVNLPVNEITIGLKVPKN